MDKVREDFEEWAISRGWDVEKVNGFYQHGFTYVAWSAWLESRNSIRVDLPHLFPFYRQGVTEALLEHGIKVNQFGSKQS